MCTLYHVLCAVYHLRVIPEIPVFFVSLCLKTPSGALRTDASRLGLGATVFPVMRKKPLLRRFKSKRNRLSCTEFLVRVLPI